MFRLSHGAVKSAALRPSRCGAKPKEVTLQTVEQASHRPLLRLVQPPGPLRAVGGFRRSKRNATPRSCHVGVPRADSRVCDDFDPDARSSKSSQALVVAEEPEGDMASEGESGGPAPPGARIKPFVRLRQAERLRSVPVSRVNLVAERKPPDPHKKRIDRR